MSDKLSVAVLHQAVEPPIINGVQKPMKPGGYKDSGADIAYALMSRQDINVICPAPKPDPGEDHHWSFPDTAEGIQSALDKGATHLWANTILFGSHPLQSSSKFDRYHDTVKVVGQPPLLVEAFDDKEVVNNILRAKRVFTMPRAWSLKESPDFANELKELNLPYPVVAKPIRGRGSHGVKVCHGLKELIDHSQSLFKESPAIMAEEFLSGEEGTVTVMPPSPDRPQYWALPFVTRFNHLNGIAPYNGVVAVTANSRAVVNSTDPTYDQVMHECQEVAKLLGVTAPIRIDVRRFKSGSKFALFDVNMKPNMTGPGRPKRDDQASLSLIAAAALGWNYQELLERIIFTATKLGDFRAVKPAADLYDRTTD